MNFLVSEDIDFLNLDAIKHRTKNVSIINLVCTKHHTPCCLIVKTQNGLQ